MKRNFNIEEFKKIKNFEYFVLKEYTGESTIDKHFYKNIINLVQTSLDIDNKYEIFVKVKNYGIFNISKKINLKNSFNPKYISSLKRGSLLFYKVKIYDNNDSDYFDNLLDMVKWCNKYKNVDAFVQLKDIGKVLIYKKRDS